MRLLINDNLFALGDHLDEAEFVLVTDDFEHARTFVFFLEEVDFGDGRDLVIILLHLLDIFLTSVESLLNTLNITPEFSVSTNSLISWLMMYFLMSYLRTS